MLAAFGQVARVEQRQVAQQRRLAATGVAEDDQPAMLGERLVDADLARFAHLEARRFAVAFGHPAGHPCARLPAAGQAALSLAGSEGALADHVLQVAAECAGAVHGGHRHRRVVADDDRGTFFGIDDLRAGVRGEHAVAGVDVAAVVRTDRHRPPSQCDFGWIGKRRGGRHAWRIAGSASAAAGNALVCGLVALHACSRTGLAIGRSEKRRAANSETATVAQARLPRNSRSEPGSVDPRPAPKRRRPGMRCLMNCWNRWLPILKASPDWAGHSCSGTHAPSTPPMP